MIYFYGKDTNRPLLAPEQIRACLPLGRTHHYKDGRSMAEAAKVWFAANGSLPPCVAAVVGSSDMMRAHFEYPLKVWGRGTSETDVMVFRRECVIAIEAKVDEDFDLTVGVWIDKRKTASSAANRREATKRYASSFGVPIERVYELRYQLLHRSLSAALAARNHGADEAWMIVQSFCRDHTSNTNKADFERFVSVVGSRPVLNGVPVRLAWVDSAPVTSCGAVSINRPSS
jgi:hypothetical protein